MTDATTIELPPPATLKELVVRYLYLHDIRDSEGASNCFAETAQAYGKDGRAEIHEFLAYLHKNALATRKHVLSNFQVAEGDDGKGLLLAYLQLYLIRDEKIDLAVTGLITVNASRSGGAWLMDGLTVALDAPYAPTDMRDGA